ncbi:MAG: peptidylprolyl isomerase [Mesonia hippocampi]|uniref:peptidylprolyl isomerase n=1 Tax=Mesonia hippocampi TaxID=1628250 RepID=UPI003F9D5AD0
MNKIIGFLGVLCCFSGIAQEKETWLLQIENTYVYADEFTYMFKQNTELFADEEHKVNNYFQLFRDYQLKAYEAERLGLDTLAGFKKEYTNFEDNFFNNYITQGPVKDNMIKEAYSRKLKELEASHILIATPDASDTLAAYKKTKDIAEQLQKGADFKEMAKKFSDDSSAKSNAGYLGWFSVFDMVYPFETAAYQTPVGEISAPVKTRFGYHIIKVHNERKNKGSRKIAHIFIQEDSLANAQKEAFMLYDLLEKGEDFSVLAKEYSDHKVSAKKGGEFGVFTRRMLRPEVFSTQAFLLEKEGTYTKPFKSEYGWHLIKLLENNPILSYEEEKPDLYQQLKQSGRAKQIQNKLVDSLKIAQANRITYAADKKYFAQQLTTLLESKEYTDFPAEKLYLKIGEEQYTYQDFLAYAENNWRKVQGLPEAKRVNAIEEMFKTEKLLTDYKKYLFTYDSDYRNKLLSYQKGMLVFELLQKQVWNKAQQDTLAQKEYYKTHQNKYVSPQSYNIDMYASPTKKEAKKIQKALRKGKDPQEINHKYNVVYTQGVFPVNSPKIPKTYTPAEKVSEIYKNNTMFVVINLYEEVPAQALAFSAVKGKVISELQEELEQALVKELRQRYNLKTNQETLRKLQQQLE